MSAVLVLAATRWACLCSSRPTFLAPWSPSRLRHFGWGTVQVKVDTEGIGIEQVVFEIRGRHNDGKDARTIGQSKQAAAPRRRSVTSSPVPVLRRFCGRRV